MTRRASAQPTAAVVINEFLASNDTSDPFATGSFDDWVELFNQTSSPVDLSGWTVSDGTNDGVIPVGVTIPANGYRVLMLSGDPGETTGLVVHLDLKLSADGEPLRLLTPAGVVSGPSWTPFPQQFTDVSYGLAPDGAENYYTSPTPGAANGIGLAGLVEPLSFSVAHGFYTSAQSVVLNTATPNATIRYTTDGTTPSEANGVEIAPGQAVTVDRTTTLRAIALRPGYLPSPSATRTYLFASDIIAQSEDTPAGWPASREVNNHIMNYGMDPEIVVGNEAAVAASLQSIPTLSIVTDLDNLFAPGDTVETQGIYSHSYNRGSDAERQASVELIDPTGAEEGFEINAGLRLRGGSSRNVSVPRHSLRLFFGSDYSGTLEYPLFGDDGTDEFEKLDLRSENGQSWMRGQPLHTFVRDVWSRDTQFAMGHPSSRSRYYHLYLNGQYWGVYQSQERISKEYAATYLGGDEDDWDILKDELLDSTSYDATDGNGEAWVSMWQYVEDQFITDAEYAALDEQVDLVGLADYYLAHFFSGESDGVTSWWRSWDGANNWYAALNREDGKWIFFEHDSENQFCNTNGPGGEVADPVNVDNTTPWPLGTRWTGSGHISSAWLHQSLITHPSYAQLFQDRMAVHFGPGGALTGPASVARMQQRADEVAAGVLAHSARWGDAARAVPYTVADWEAAISGLEACILGRGAVVTAQLAADGFVASAPAPTLSPADGFTSFAAAVTITPSVPGTVWYTLDGTDPLTSDTRIALTGSLSLTSPVTVVTARTQAADGSWSAAAMATYELTGLGADAPVIVNEYNAVSSSNYLGGGEAGDLAEGSDVTLGRVLGNGGDWFELVLTENGLDLRGWQVQLWDADNADDVLENTDTFIFGNDPLLASLPAGTIITVSESFADDISFDPAGGDWHINLQSNSADTGAFITAASQSNFDTNKNDTRIAILNPAGEVVTVRTGEGTAPEASVSSSEVFKLEAAPSGSILADAEGYDDGTSSSFGAPNRWDDGTSIQDFSAIRNDAPTAATLAPITANGLDLTLSWSGATDPETAIAEYAVLRDGVEIARVPGTATSYVDTVVYGPQYAYEVIAYDPQGFASPSSNTETGTGLDIVAPDAANVNLGTITPNSVALSWTGGSDDVAIVSYAVERNSGAGFVEIARIDTSAPAASYVDGDVDDLVTYRYRVFTIDASGNVSAPSSAVEAEVPDGTDPIASLSLITVTADAVTLDWSATDNGTIVNRVLDREGGDESVTVADPVAANPVVDAGLAPDTTYAYTLTVTDAEGNVGNAVLNVVTAGYTVPVIGSIDADPDGASLLVDWSTSPEPQITGYEVVLTGPDAPGPISVAGVANSETLISGLVSAAEYCAEVRSVDAEGASSALSARQCGRTVDVVDPVIVSFADAGASADWIDVAWSVTDNLGVETVTLTRTLPDGSNPAMVDVTPTTILRDTGVTPGASYRYELVVADAAGNETSASFVVTAPGLTPPTGLSSSGIGETGFVASWNPATENAVQQYIVTVTGPSAPGPITVTDPTVTVTGLNPASSYSYTVVSATAGALVVSPASAPLSINTVDITAPDAPVISVSQVAASQVALAMTSVDNVGVDSYEIRRDGVLVETAAAGAPPSHGASFTDTGLVDATVYSYTITAVDAAGGRSETVLSVTTPPLPPPTSLTVSDITASNATVEFANSSDALIASHVVTVRNPATGQEAVTTIPEGEASTLSIDGLAELSAYTIEVVAIDQAGNVSALAGPQSIITADATDPVVSLNAVATGPGSIDLSWSATDNGTISALRLFRSDGNAETLLADVAGASSYRDLGLDPTTTFAYRLEAVDGGANTASATAQTVTLALPIPTLADAVDVTGTSAAVTWTTPGDAGFGPDDLLIDGYEIVAAAGDGTQTTFTTPGRLVANTILNDLTPATTYSVAVRSLSGEIASDSSAPITLVTPDTLAPTIDELAVTAATADEVTVAWTAADNVAIATAELFRSVDGGSFESVAVLDPVDTTIVDPVDTPGSSVVFRLVVADAAGNDTETDTAASTQIPALAVPLNVGQAEPLGEDTITIVWDASPEARVTGYEVNFLDGDGLARTETTTTNSFDWTGFAAADSYQFQVRSFDDATNMSALSEILVATTVDLTAPDEPVIITDTLTASTASLSWSSFDQVGIVGYRLTRAASDGSTLGPLELATPTFFDSDLIPGQNYTYSVVALDEVGNLSPAADLVIQTLALPIPQDVTVASIGGDSFDVTWNTAPLDDGIVAHEVEFSAAGTVFGKTVVDAPALKALVADLPGAGSYNVTVASIDAAGNRSVKSAAAPAVTADDLPPLVAFETATAPDLTAVGLQWSGTDPNLGGLIPGAVVAYTLQRVDAAGETVTLLDNQPNVQFNDTGAQPGTDATYEVIAFDAAGNASPAATVLVAIPPLEQPTNIALTNLDDGHAVEVTWSASSNPDQAGYVIVVTNELGDVVQEVQAPQSPFEVSSGELTPGNTFTFTVAAVDGRGFLSAPTQPLSLTVDVETTNPEPTAESTAEPTNPEPTTEPTAEPTVEPTNPEPTNPEPTTEPTAEPTNPEPTTEPTAEPTAEPTNPEPNAEPSAEPTAEPTNPEPDAEVTIGTLGDRLDRVGDAIDFTVKSEGESIRHTANGLPPGVAINRKSGAITGVLTEEGIYEVTVSVSSRRAASSSFTWTVLPLAPPEPDGATNELLPPTAPAPAPPAPAPAPAPAAPAPAPAPPASAPAPSAPAPAPSAPAPAPAPAPSAPAPAPAPPAPAPAPPAPAPAPAPSAPAPAPAPPAPVPLTPAAPPPTPATPPPVAPPPAPTAPSLAVTGGQVSASLILATALLGVGIGMVVVGRRSKRAE